MSNNNNAITNARALALAIEFIDSPAQMPAFTSFCEPEPYACDSVEVLNKLRNMHANMTKPRKKPEGETAAHRRNRENAEKLADMANADEVFTTKRVCEKLGLLYPASATAVMNVGIELGIWERAPKEKASAPTTYRLVADRPEENI